ncbi:hypothetical protein UFOVP1290_6 [uncultured Caudovirales phage]|uniref:Uncharacterized protein n=1 Tax=uncultured Caudovirales phage TaxID=2100421 RepID=A0A6J5RQD7_9CAUD|nr:hypothetical protein UFOVP1290_6 [uncultured Caudovirales phage]
MADTPNYKSNVGRLVTDRYDFEKHINGEDFTHTGNFLGSHITIDPVVSIDTNTLDGTIVCSDANTAIQAISINLANPIRVNTPSASTIVKGIVQLAGDIKGTSTNVIVSGLQERTVSDALPSDGDLLTWDLGTTSWIPARNAAYFSASGDLNGTNSTQYVASITGDSNILSIKCDNLRFDESVEPTIYFIDNSSLNGLPFQILGQNSTADSGNGGDIDIKAGAANGTGTGLDGHVSIQTNGKVALQASSLSSDRTVLSLLGVAGASEMPSNTGDCIIYIADAITAPTSGNPVDGCILYSSTGNLRIKQSDGTDFQVGSLANPFVWGDSSNPISTSYYVKESRDDDVAKLVTSFVLSDETAVAIDAIFIGKSLTTNKFMYYHKTMGYVRSGGTSADVGMVTDIEVARLTGGLSLTEEPTITRSTNTISIKTGRDATYNIMWSIIVKLYFVADS